MDLLHLFEWFDASLLADAAKAYGGVFVLVQGVHLLALAVLGGMVLAGDLRMLGVLLRSVPARIVIEETRRWFTITLVLLVLSGTFMSAAVAIKLYYSEMFLAKMVALAVGIVFFYCIRQPLYRLASGATGGAVSRVAVRLTAVASLGIWFTVAASGRWIGFS
jgi:hypothetical protein